MRTLKRLLFLGLLGAIGYQANAYYQFRKAAEAVPPRVKTVAARAGDLRITLSGSGILQALQSKVVSVREVQALIVQIVQDGAMVQAGQVACQLDTTSVLKELRDRQAAYDDAQDTVAKTEADVLLNLNNAETKAKKARQQQKTLLATSAATTDQARAQVAFSGSELDQAKRQYTRQDTLARDQLVPARDAEMAHLNVQGKQLSVVTSSKQLEVQQQTEKISASQADMLLQDARFTEESAKNKAHQQVENARYNALQARRMLELSQMQLGWCTIKAPISGMAVVARDFDPSVGTERPLRPGDQAFPSRRLMEVIDTSQMIVQADVGEIDIGHVRVGQSARVFPRAAPGLALRSRVKSVSEVAQAPPTWRSNRLPGKKVFRVVLSVLDSRPRLLRPGMTADFEVVEETVPHGILAPIQAVFPCEEARRATAASDHPAPSREAAPRRPDVRAHRRAVAHSAGRDHGLETAALAPSEGMIYVRKEGRYWPRTVKTGKRNDTDVMITQGLKPGEVLAVEKPPTSLIGPATKPRVQVGGMQSLLPSWITGR